MSQAVVQESWGSRTPCPWTFTWMLVVAPPGSLSSGSAFALGAELADGSPGSAQAARYGADGEQEAHRPSRARSEAPAANFAAQIPPTTDGYTRPQALTRQPESPVLIAPDHRSPLGLFTAGTPRGRRLPRPEPLCGRLRGSEARRVEPIVARRVRGEGCRRLPRSVNRCEFGNARPAIRK